MSFRSVIAIVRKQLRLRLVQNVLILYGVYFIRYGVQAVLIGFLARVLAPAGLGDVAAALSLGTYLSLIVDYGFIFSGARDVARKREDVQARATIFASVMGAKLILTAGVVAVAAAAQLAVPIFAHNPLLVWSATVWATTQAIYPLWYFQGLERMRLVGLLDIGARVMSLGAIVLLVRGSADGWKVFAIQTVFFVTITAVAMLRAYSEIPFVAPSLLLSWRALRDGFQMFIVWVAANFYAAGNALILSYFAPAHAVGYYAGAERIVRPVTGLLHPINASVMPRMSRLSATAPREASKLVRSSARIMVVVGLLMSLGLFIAAPLIVRVLLGPDYGPSVVVMRILAALPLLFSISHLLGLQWMIPRGMDRAYGWTLMAAGIFNVALAVLLAPHYAEVGMAWTAIGSEAFVALSLFAILRSRGPLFRVGVLDDDEGILAESQPL